MISLMNLTRAIRTLISVSLELLQFQCSRAALSDTFALRHRSWLGADTHEIDVVPKDSLFII